MTWTIKVLIVESVIPLSYKLALIHFSNSMEARVYPGSFAYTAYSGNFHFLNRKYEIKIENCKVEYELTK